MYMHMPYSGFFKAETRFSPQKTISSAVVSIVLSRVTPGIIKITLFALIFFAYLFTCVHLLNKYFIMYVSCMLKMHA